jgi:hypothetical protein
MENKLFVFPGFLDFHYLVAFPFFILYMRLDLARFATLIGKFASAIGSNSFFNAPA